MKCSNCDANVPKGTLFCSECGQKLTLPEISYVPEVVPCQTKTTKKDFRTAVNKILCIAKAIGIWLYKNVRITPNDTGFVLITVATLLVMSNIYFDVNSGWIIIVSILVIGCVFASLPRAVYVFDNRYFHLNHKCNGMEGSKMMSAKNARQSGLIPCYDCTGFSFKSLIVSVLKFFCIIFVVSFIVTSIYNKEYKSYTLFISLFLSFMSMLIIGLVYDSLKNGYEKVWIQSGNMKYHKNKDCSNMKAARKIRVVKAKSFGYVPCGKCCKHKKTNY